MQLGNEHRAGIFRDRRFDHTLETVCVRKTTRNQFITRRLVDDQHDRLSRRQVNAFQLVFSMIVFGKTLRCDRADHRLGLANLAGVELLCFQDVFQTAWLAGIIVDAGAVHDH